MARKTTRKRPSARTAKPPPRKRGRPHTATASKKVPAAETADALVAASAEALRLPLDPAWLPGVKFNLQLILRLATVVDEFPLPDDAEPAPVFHA